MKIIKTISKGIGVILLGILLFAASLVGGYLFAGVINTAASTLGFWGYLLIILGLILTFYISITVHEAGHLVFGLLTGYSFSSFRIGSLMWIKQDGKIKLRCLTISGTGGQCLMTPPERENGRIPVVLYNLGGVLMNIIFSTLLVLLYLFLAYIPILSEFFVIAAALSFVIAITNGIPLAPGGMPNDGMNAYYLAGNKTARVAFRNQLLMNAEQAKGARLSDMPDEWFALPEDADMQNVHCASIAVFAASRTMESMDFAKAESEIKSLLDSDYKMASIHRNLLACDLVYCRLVLDGTKAEISSILTINQQKFMQSMKTFPSVLRTEYAVALIRDKSVEKAEKTKQKFEKTIKTYPYPQDAETEKGFMEYAEKAFSVGEGGPMELVDEVPLNCNGDPK